MQLLTKHQELLCCLPLPCFCQGAHDNCTSKNRPQQNTHAPAHNVPSSALPPAAAAVPPRVQRLQPPSLSGHSALPAPAAAGPVRWPSQVARSEHVRTNVLTVNLKDQEKGNHHTKVVPLPSSHTGRCQFLQLLDLCIGPVTWQGVSMSEQTCAQCCQLLQLLDLCVGPVGGKGEQVRTNV